MVSLCRGLCQREEFQKLHEITRGLSHRYKRPISRWTERTYMNNYKRCAGCEIYFRGQTKPSDYVAKHGNGIIIQRYRCPCCGRFARTTKRNSKTFDRVQREIEERRMTFLPLPKDRRGGLKLDIQNNIDKWNKLLATTIPACK